MYIPYTCACLMRVHSHFAIQSPPKWKGCVPYHIWSVGYSLKSFLYAGNSSLQNEFMLSVCFVSTLKSNRQAKNFDLFICNFDLFIY